MSAHAVLTRKYGCDMAVVGLLRARTLGNSPTALCHNLHEVHSEEWMRKQFSYLGDCERHRRRHLLGATVTKYEEAAPFPRFPVPKWFLAVYIRDVWSRLPELRAAVTSVFGSILKVDSTKKVVKKLQGAAAGSATWVTNIGNERGEVLMSVVTQSEGAPGLQKMAEGLMMRYESAGQTPPCLLYTDRDCCSQHSETLFSTLFCKWPTIQVRLDIWHFMRRLARGCTSESHPLYGTFMAKLSPCIFEWDTDDYEQLLAAKRGELVADGVLNPSTSAVQKALCRQELQRHCRRRTRGTEETVEAIESLLLAFSPATDALGMPLLREEMKDIWQEQRHHVKCLQDPPSIQLYTETARLVKGGVSLPVFRCARGSTSLESFHLHLARFIPGTSASAVNYHAYLLDGITRWNTARADAAIKASSCSNTLRSFNSELKGKINALSQSVQLGPVFPHHQPPSSYTGELFGVEYLFNQSEGSFCPTEDELDNLIDEGFDEEEVASEHVDCDDDFATTLPVDPESDEGEEEERSEAGPQKEGEAEQEVDDISEVLDSRGIPGWDKVEKLAKALLSLKGLSISKEQARNISSLYDQLDSYDKKPLVFIKRYSHKATGRFARSRRRVEDASIDYMKRCFLSAGSPASCPSRSRVVEALCILLCEKYPHPRKERDSQGRRAYTSRWRLVISEYNSAKARLFNSQTLLDATNLTLYTINEATLVKWYKKTSRMEEIKMLMQGLSLPSPSVCATQPLPPARQRPSSPPPTPTDPHPFHEPEDTTGRACVRGSSRQSTPVPFPVQSIVPMPASQKLRNTPVPEQATLPTEVVQLAEVEVQTTTVPRTTAWRQRKRTAAVATLPQTQARRKYTCRICGEPMASTGHSQFYGKRYCPNSPEQVPKEEWLAQRRAEKSGRSN